MSDFVVGLTGGIGSGKTTVTNLFAEHGITIVDADIIAREVVAVGSSGLQQIAHHFGKDVLLKSGELNRPKLREIVFAKPEHKAWLDALLHPLIREQMQLQTKQASSAYCILSVPLLVENSLVHMVNRVLVVDVDENTQLKRAVSRDSAQGSDEATIKAIMQNQCTRQERLAVADDVVNNNHSEADLSAQVDTLHTKYLTLASQTPRSPT
ncbi:dephospho-CoA kinase [Glaciecola siphonariae]|uniref:Dephospho-CoA kinase n=1 Tax=Glaciecola siphonariae TaxID=521012 RepID=A0ABV9LW57_9ALTE